MHGGGWMAGEAFGIADVHQAREQLQRVNKAGAAFSAVLQAKVELWGQIKIKRIMTM